MENKDVKDNYYQAYEKRYSQVYENDMLWSSLEPSPDVLNFLQEFGATKSDKILELGCGEGRDAIFLLDRGYSVLAVDYSSTVIKKCMELSNHKYDNCFISFDLIKDELNDKFDYIYSIAVLHMFVLDEHRNKFWTFIKEHLNKDGKVLVCVLGDGYEEYSSDITKAFDDAKRVVLNNNANINIATTSCKIVNWESMEKEIKNNGLKLEKKWISIDIPEFNNSMCVVVSK